MSRHGPVEEDDYVDVVHVTDEDVSDAVGLRELTPEQRRAIDLLELNLEHRPWVRLTRAQWGWVDRVVHGLRTMGVPDVRETGEKPLNVDARAEVPRPRVSGPGEREGSYVTTEKRGNQ